MRKLPDVPTTPLRRLLQSASLISIVAGVSTGAAAQPVPGQNVLPTIEVISPTTVPTPEAQIGSSVTVVTAQDIERQQRRTVPDILATVPGLHVVQSGGPGGLTSIFIRGTNSNHTKVLIDGIDVSDPSNPSRLFDFGHLLAEDIERIEVLRGPQSGLYGADAIGGVISVTTKRGSGPAKISGMIEGGSHKTLNQAAGLRGSKDNFDYAFNVTHFNQAETPVTPAYTLLPVPGRAPIPNFYENYTASTKMGVTVSEQFRLNFTGRFTKSELHFTGDESVFFNGTFTSVPRAQQGQADTRQMYSRAEAVWTGFDGRWTNYFGANYTDVRSETQTIPGATPTLNAGRRSKVDWRGVALLMPGQTLVTGAEKEVEIAGVLGVRGAQNANTGVYAELQSQFAERFFVVSNVRHDVNERFGEATTYRVAPALLLPVTETKLKASYGTGFKTPTLNQLFADFPAFSFFANPNLLPEESRGWDAGFEQPLFNDRVRFGATYFHNDIVNLINSAPAPTLGVFASTLVNVGKAETSGVEAFVSVRPIDRLSMRADYTYTDATDAITGFRLLRRPRHKGSFTTAWTPIDPLTLSATVLYVGEFIDFNRSFSIPRLIAPAYTVVNVAADYRVNENTKVFARIDNLFNEHYEDPTGFLRPGFAVYGGVRLTN